MEAPDIASILLYLMGLPIAIVFGGGFAEILPGNFMGRQGVSGAQTSPISSRLAGRGSLMISVSAKGGLFYFTQIIFAIGYGHA